MVVSLVMHGAKITEMKIYLAKRKVLVVATVTIFVVLCFNALENDEAFAEDKEKQTDVSQAVVNNVKEVHVSDSRKPEYNAYATKNLQKRIPGKKGFTFKDLMNTVQELFPQSTLKADMTLDMKNMCLAISYGDDKSIANSNTAFDIFHSSTSTLPASNQPAGLPVLPDATDGAEKTLNSVVESHNLHFISTCQILEEDNSRDFQHHGFYFTVFIVPHFHSDTGWTSTDDRYSSKENINVLNVIVDMLTRHSKRRFVWSDVALLEAWWETATPDRRVRMKRIVMSGQFEVASGTWSTIENMPLTHYYSMIDQFVEGPIAERQVFCQPGYSSFRRLCKKSSANKHLYCSLQRKSNSNEWLRRTLGIRARNSWALDPFGHTSTFVYLSQKMNHANVLLQRAPHISKREMALTSSFEFNWKTKWHQRSKAGIFTHVMPLEPYDSPNTCGPDARTCCQFDFFRLKTPYYNCPCKTKPLRFQRDGFVKNSALLLDQYREKAKLFKTDTLLVTLGDDFRGSSVIEASVQYDNYTDVFHYINTRPVLNAKIQFATLSEYFDVLKSDYLKKSSKKIQFHVDDPEAETTDVGLDDIYWKGYHVSRTYYKILKRKLESHLRGAEIISTMAFSVVRLTGIWPEFPTKLYPLLIEARRNLALFQHDDASAIVDSHSKTPKYRKEMIKSIMDLKLIMHLSSKVLLLRNRSNLEIKTTYFGFEEVFSEVTQIAQKKVLKFSTTMPTHHVIIYNSLTYKRTGVVSLHVSTPHVVVLTSDRKAVESQVNLLWTDDAKEPREDAYEIQFHVDVSAAGLQTYMIKTDVGGGAMWAYSRQLSHVYFYNTQLPAAQKKKMDPFIVVEADSTNDIVLQNENLLATFSPHSGFLQLITKKHTKAKFNIELDFLTYESSIAMDKSGVYRFFLVDPGKDYIRKPKNILRVVRGPITSYVQALLPDLIHQVTLHSCDKHRIGAQPLGIHVSNYVNTRKVSDKNELTMRLKTGITSNKFLFVDENGYQLRRQKYNEELPVSLNFHPMTSMAFIENTVTRFSIITGHPVGVASLKEGQVEVVLDRVVIQNKSGVNKDEALFERTLQSFVILVEDRGNFTRDRPWRGLSFASLAAHQLSWEIHHPFVFMSRKVDFGDFVLKASTNPLKNQYVTWSCEIHLVNLRSIHSPDCDVPTEEAALIVHRVVADYSFDTAKQFKPLCTRVDASDSVNLRKASLFSANEAVWTSLSLQGRGEGLHTIYSSIDVRPMEIAVYKIILGVGL